MINEKNITVGKNSGFCFGVKRAADAVEKLLAEKKDGERIFTLGKLIHNDVYNSRLAERGVSVIKETELENILEQSKNGEKLTVVLRAHGVSAECDRKLTDRKSVV